MASQRKLTKEYDKARAKAARWIFDNQKVPQWWTWAVLTKHNTAANSLNLDDTLAFNIFSDLAKRGLLIPGTIPMPGTNQSQPVAYLDLGNRQAWEEVMSPPGWLSRAVRSIMTNAGFFVFWVASTAITAAVTAVVTAWATKLAGSTGG